MATYSFKTWETINLPSVSGDTYFRILRQPSADPSSVQSGVIYDGLILNGFGIQNLNEILSQYVYVEPLTFNSNEHMMQDDEQIWTFYIYYTQDDWETFTSDTVTLTYNWAYDSSNSRIKSTKPINIIDYRQWVIYSTMSRDGSEEPFTVHLVNNTIDSYVIEGSSTWTYIRKIDDLNYPGEFTIAYSYDFFVNRNANQLDSTNRYKLDINGNIYWVSNTCYDFCLYYLNQYGGYDYMLFAGREMQTDNLSRLSYKQNYIANSNEFGKIDYLTTISESWSLNTSWVTDIQAEKLKHLFTSNKIWLQDLNTGHITPVNITNKSFEHRTWKNQGRKLFSFTIDVTSSQEKYTM